MWGFDLDNSDTDRINESLYYIGKAIYLEAPWKKLSNLVKSMQVSKFILYYAPTFENPYQEFYRSDNQ